MALVLAAVCAAGAVALLLAPADDGRLRRVLVEAPRAGAAARRTPSAAGSACLVAGLSAVLLAPGWPGLAVGLLVAGAGPVVLGRLEPADRRAERERLAADLPLVLDLLSACLAGGASLPAAADAVALAVPGPAGRRLAEVSAALASGFPAAQAWLVLAGHASGSAAARSAFPWSAGEEDPLASAARTLARAAEGGAPVAAAVSRLAADARAQARARGEQTARRVGVLAVAPLGLCFLPAFVLLGVVPVVAGLAAPLLSSF